MKVRKQFDLQTAEFSEESSDDDRIICNQLIEKYNKDYSLILSETKNFFSDCKDFITRFLTANNMGIGFNLPLMLNTLLRIETKTLATGKFKEKLHWQQKRETFENDFNKIVIKMGEVIQQLLQFEVKIKTAYLGEAFNSPYKVKTKVSNTKLRQKMGSQTNLFLSQSNEQGENQEQEKMLRTILQKNLRPNNQSKETVCRIQESPASNIQKLSNKLDALKTKIQNEKEKEEKIWNIFNEKRPSRNNQNEKFFLDSEEKYRNINSMLSDVISHRNKGCYSPFETVESSFC